MRKTTGSAALLLAAIGTAMPGAATALGLGGLEVQSDLFRPFQARIPMRGIDGLRSEDIRVGLASASEFQRLGLERPQALQKLEFRYSERAGESYIEIVGSKPQREPMVQLLISVEWPGGRLLREYTALLDPPGWEQAQAAPSIAIAAAADSAASDRGAVQPARAAPRQSLPDAAGGSYGPVRAGETLGAIARGYSAAGADLNQVLLALLRANPQAFGEVAGEANMNLLKRGAILRLPSDDELRATSASAAQRVVQAQYRAFRGQPAESASGTDSGSGAGAPKPAEAAADAATPAATPAATDSGRQLSLLPAEQDQGSAALDAITSGLDLQQQVSDLRRLVELKDEQIAAAQSTLASFDAEIATLRTLVDLRDAELQELRDELNALRGEIATAPASGSGSAAAAGLAPAVSGNGAASPAPGGLAAPLAASAAAAGVAGGDPAAAASIALPSAAPLPAGVADEQPGDAGLAQRLLRSPLSALLGLPALLGLLWYLRRRSQSRKQRRGERDAADAATSNYRRDPGSELRATLDGLHADELPGNAVDMQQRIAAAAPATAAPAAAESAAASAEPAPSGAGRIDGRVEAPATEAGEPQIDSDPTLDANGAAPAKADSGEVDQALASLDLDERLPDAGARLLDEVDVYLAYGLYDQAAEMIRRGLARDPGKPELLARRLEALLLDGKHEQFAALGVEYRESILDADWARLAERAANLGVAMPGEAAADSAPAAPEPSSDHLIGAARPVSGAGERDQSSELPDLDSLDQVAERDAAVADLGEMLPDLPDLDLPAADADAGFEIDADATLNLEQPDAEPLRRVSPFNEGVQLDGEDELSLLLDDDAPADEADDRAEPAGGAVDDGEPSLLEKLGASDFMLDGEESVEPPPEEQSPAAARRRGSGG